MNSSGNDFASRQSSPHCHQSSVGESFPPGRPFSICVLSSPTAEPSSTEPYPPSLYPDIDTASQRTVPDLPPKAISRNVLTLHQSSKDNDANARNRAPHTSPWGVWPFRYCVAVGSCPRGARGTVSALRGSEETPRFCPFTVGLKNGNAALNTIAGRATSRECRMSETCMSFGLVKQALPHAPQTETGISVSAGRRRGLGLRPAFASSRGRLRLTGGVVVPLGGPLLNNRSPVLSTTALVANKTVLSWRIPWCVLLNSSSGRGLVTRSSTRSVPRVPSVRRKKVSFFFGRTFPPFSQFRCQQSPMPTSPRTRGRPPAGPIRPKRILVSSLAFRVPVPSVGCCSSLWVFWWPAGSTIDVTQWPSTQQVLHSRD